MFVMGKFMIWLLIVITLSGNISMQPFTTKSDCEQAKNWILANTGPNAHTTVKNSTCMKIDNPYLK